MTPLCELAEKYYSDKGPSGHNYTPTYHRLFCGRREYVTRVLELGIGKDGLLHSKYKRGASLLMWREYFPYAQIVGVDKDERAMVTGHERISTYLCDLSSRLEIQVLRETLGQIYEQFDLIVDDASHSLKDQILAADTFLPAMLRSGGHYFIEDVFDIPELARRQFQRIDEVGVRGNWYML